MLTGVIAYLKKLFVGNPKIIAPTKLPPPNEVIVIGSASSGKSRNTRSLFRELFFREIICLKIANDLSETIEKEWWN